MIENAARHAGYPVGPIAVQDETTIDLSIKIHKQSIEDLGDDYKPMSSIDVMQKMYDLGRLGKRFGGSFMSIEEERNFYGRA